MHVTLATITSYQRVEESRDRLIPFEHRDSDRVAAMAMRRETGVQGDLVATWAEMPRSPGHAFYDKLQKLLTEAGYDGLRIPGIADRYSD